MLPYGQTEAPEINFGRYLNKYEVTGKGIFRKSVPLFISVFNLKGYGILLIRNNIVIQSNCIRFKNKNFILSFVVKVWFYKKLR